MESKVKKETRGRKPKYQLSTLQVGKSLLVIKTEKTTRRLLTTVVNQYRRNHNKSATFKIKENEKNFRITRTA